MRQKTTSNYRLHDWGEERTEDGEERKGTRTIIIHSMYDQSTETCMKRLHQETPFYEQKGDVLESENFRGTNLMDISLNYWRTVLPRHWWKSGREAPPRIRRSRECTGCNVKINDYDRRHYRRNCCLCEDANTVVRTQHGGTPSFEFGVGLH